MAYHTKGDALRGPAGSWMRRERVSRGWSVADVSDELAAIGTKVSPATLRQYEAGPRQPGAELHAALVRLFGTEPEAAPEHKSDIDRLADAIDRLALALARRAR